MNQLPEDLWSKAFCFVGDAQDLYSCEKTCRSFHRILRDDEIWGFCAECQSLQFDTTNRESAFINRALKKCKKWLKSTNSAILDVLTVDDWEMLAIASMASLGEFCHELVGKRHRFHLRGDTLGTLLATVEGILVTQFKRAFRLTMYRESQGYPTVFACDWIAQAEFQDFEMKDSPLIVKNKAHESSLYYDTLTVGGRDIVDVKTHDQIIRRLAYRAGIPKLDKGIFPVVWGSLQKTIAKLMDPACMRLAERSLENADQKQVLQVGETIRDVSPLPELSTFSGEERIVHWIVPKQIEEASKDIMGIGGKVYGGVWLVDDSDFGVDADDAAYWEIQKAKIKHEIEIAESKYCFIHDDDDDGDDDMDAN